MRVLAALSGGVDSAVAAARAVDAGHEVVGVHMALTRNRAQTRSGSRGCCSIEDSADARWAAQILGIPFYVWDLSEEFEERVVADFLDEYRAGRTPNPCVRCNERVKFDALLERALALGFDAVATGHYARLSGGASSGRPGDTAGLTLRRAVDAAKDQSYVLGVLDAGQLAHSFFPLGDTTKPAIREEARAIEEGRLDRTNNPLKNAPHTVEDLVGEWDRPYSREQACFPPGAFRVDKYWSPVNRVDNVYGDRNLICTCPPLEEYAEAAE